SGRVKLAKRPPRLFGLVSLDRASLKARSLPSNARSAERGAFHHTAPNHLRSRDNGQLNRGRVEMLRGASSPTGCDHEFVGRRGPFRSSPVDSRKLSRAIAPTKALCESIQHLHKLKL